MVAEAAGRGAALTERMLAMARRQAGGHHDPSGGTSAVIEDPGRALVGIGDLLRRTLRSGIEVRLEARGPLPAAIRGARAELEAALINLAVNARDAMPAGDGRRGGGRITIAAAAEMVAEAARHPAGLPPGRYLRLSVADTGIGMDAATLARATEAFFTTKPAGQGTGLGLATVRAFVEEAGGALRIESTPGQGTTVAFWLPESEAAPAALA
jgi:signal transduction histidine kinase